MDVRNLLFFSVILLSLLAACRHAPDLPAATPALLTEDDIAEFKKGLSDFDESIPRGRYGQDWDASLPGGEGFQIIVFQHPTDVQWRGYAGRLGRYLRTRRSGDADAVRPQLPPGCRLWWGITMSGDFVYTTDGGTWRVQGIPPDLLRAFDDDLQALRKVRGWMPLHPDTTPIHIATPSMGGGFEYVLSPLDVTAFEEGRPAQATGPAADLCRAFFARAASLRTQGSGERLPSEAIQIHIRRSTEENSSPTPAF